MPRLLLIHTQPFYGYTKQFKTCTYTILLKKLMSLPQAVMVLFAPEFPF